MLICFLGKKKKLFFFIFGHKSCQMSSFLISLGGGVTKTSPWIRHLHMHSLQRTVRTSPHKDPTFLDADSVVLTERGAHNLAP